MANLLTFPGLNNMNSCRGVFGGSRIKTESPQEYSAAALEQFPPCNDNMPFVSRRPKWVKIQQPPRAICRKRYINVMQRIYEPKIIPIQRTVDMPHVCEVLRRARIPKINYRIQIIKEPKLIYEPTEWTGPVLVTRPYVTCEPQEVCSTFICRPKPQYVYVPPPDMYCCDPQGTIYTTGSSPCPPNLCAWGNTCRFPNPNYPNFSNIVL